MKLETGIEVRVTWHLRGPVTFIEYRRNPADPWVSVGSVDRADPERIINLPVQCDLGPHWRVTEL